MPFKKTREEKSKKKYEDACWFGYCPNLAERENSRIKELATRLKAYSKKETLTNISEWQYNNMAYWFERYPLSNILAVSIIIFLVSLSTCYILGLWWLIAIFGTASATLLAITILMITYYRKIPLKQFYNIFSFSISINFLLERELAICRDYAKLTASLLFNMYPEMDIYFVHAPGHIATGIIVEKKLYILDNNKPVATIDKWHERWNKGRFSTKKVDRAKATCMESVPLPSLLSKTSSPKLDTDMLANKLQKLLSIQSLPDDSRKDSLKILEWKNGAILYEDDEIVNYSLAQRVKTMLSRETLDIDHVASVTIDRKKDYLIFQVKIK